MMKKIALFCLAILMAAGNPAWAAEGDTYAVAQYAMIEVDFDGIGDVDPTALVGRFGVFVTDNAAIEGRLGVGLRDDDIIGVDVDVDTLFGAYLAFHSRPSGGNSFYAVFGFTEGELDFSGPGGSISDDESGLSFGIGARIGQINIEYMNYLDEDDFDATAISIGFVF